MSDNFEELLALNKKISSEERTQLISFLSKTLKTREIKNNVVKDKEEKNSCSCPNCNCHNVKKNGNHIDSKGKKVQKYKCCECHKIFRDSTNTTVENIKKIERWEEFINYTLKDLSLRKIAEEMGNITHITLFNWRKKFIKSLEKIDIENLYENIKSKE